MFNSIFVFNVILKMLGPSFYPHPDVLLWKVFHTGEVIHCNGWLLISLLILTW